MTGVEVLGMLNYLLPRGIALYKRLRGEARDLGANIQTYTDADMIALLESESTETVALADAMLAKTDEPPA